MSLQQEADRLRSALLETPLGSRFDRLHAAQQALAWAADQDTFKSPYDLVIGNPEGSEGCPSSSSPGTS